MSQLIMDETEEQQQFHKFELVWAKILGWPWWPARITQIPAQKSGNYRVEFFADTSHAYLPSEKLMCFVQGRDRHSTPKGHYRNFAKALALANRLLQTTFAAKEEPQSQCTSRDRLPHQQIQIINYSQQAQTSPKPHSQPQPQPSPTPQPQYQASSSTRKPKNPIKRRDRTHGIPHALHSVQEEKQLKELLVRYKLDHITERRTRNQQARGARKGKAIAKKFLEMSGGKVDVQGRTVRLICKALSKKDIDLQYRYKISLSLMDSLFRNRQKGVEGVHRALFQWIKCTDGNSIMKNYASWPTECKADQITNEGNEDDD